MSRISGNLEQESVRFGIGLDDGQIIDAPAARMAGRPSLTLRVMMLQPYVIDAPAARMAGRPSLALRVTIFVRGGVCRAAR